MSTNIPTDTFPVPVLTPVQERQLCVAFFGLSLYKNGRDGDELDVRKQTAKRVKTAPVSRSRVPHSSILQRRTPLRCIPVASFKRSALAADDKMEVDSPSRVSLKRSAPDDDRMDVDAPPLKRVKAPFFLADCPLVNDGPVATVTFTELVIVVNAYDGLSDGQKAGLDRWNARCNDGHLSQHAPVAVGAPVTVKIIELIYKPYGELGEYAKRAWDSWNAKCEAAGGSSFAKSEKALGKRRAVEPLVDVTNLGGRSGRKAQQRSKRQILSGVTPPAGAWFLSNIACLGLAEFACAGVLCLRRLLDTICLTRNPTVLTAAATRILLGMTTPVGAWTSVVLLLARLGAWIDLLDPEYVLLISSSIERALTSSQNPTVLTAASIRILLGVTTPNPTVLTTAAIRILVGLTTPGGAWAVVNLACSICSTSAGIDLLDSESPLSLPVLRRDTRYSTLESDDPGRCLTRRQTDTAWLDSNCLTSAPHHTCSTRSSSSPPPHFVASYLPRRGSIRPPSATARRPLRLQLGFANTTVFTGLFSLRPLPRPGLTVSTRSQYDLCLIHVSHLRPSPRRDPALTRLSQVLRAFILLASFTPPPTAPDRNSTGTPHHPLILTPPSTSPSSPSPAILRQSSFPALDLELAPTRHLLPRRDPQSLPVPHQRATFCQFSQVCSFCLALRFLSSLAVLLFFAFALLVVSLSACGLDDHDLLCVLSSPIAFSKICLPRTLVFKLKLLQSV
ncbi:hypothetical protein C8R46DRAFT_1294053 [Mycena filopes]|nr:hypothetical protein C8R46DRAFT_1294053 [Mycena filopes]